MVCIEMIGDEAAARETDGGSLAASPGVAAASYVAYDHDRATRVAGGVIDEGQACIYVNGVELATVMCSPFAIKDLALGFLRLEGLIEGLGDVRQISLSKGGMCADVWLNREFSAPTRRILTSGCGGGLTFDDLSAARPSIVSPLRVTPAQIIEGMRQAQLAGELYRLVRGVHTACLSDGARLVFIAQDIGRHNTLDRLCGMALQAGYETRDHVLFTSGRISSEMLSKASRMGVPIVVSRTSPTSLSVRLAKAWNITAVGYCRGNQFRVYSGEDRIRPVA
jgi:FdhD protein